MSSEHYCPHGARWTTCPETHPPRLTFGAVLEDKAKRDEDALTWENLIKMELRATDAESKLRIAEVQIAEQRRVIDILIKSMTEGGEKA